MQMVDRLFLLDLLLSSTYHPPAIHPMAGISPFSIQPSLLIPMERRMWSLLSWTLHQPRINSIGPPACLNLVSTGSSNVLLLICRVVVALLRSNMTAILC